MISIGAVAAIFSSSHGCGPAPEQKPTRVETSETTAATLDQLSPDSDVDAIVEHLYQAEILQTGTSALSEHFPEMTREHAYQIQNARLAHREKTAERVGWKIGWSLHADPDGVLDPVFGHVMSDRVYSQNQPLSTRYFSEGSTGAEAEVVFYLNQDLPGPQLTGEEVVAAVEEVGVAMEFVSSRLRPFGEVSDTREHAVADDVYSAGVVLGAERFRLEEVDFTKETGQVIVNGEVEGEGHATHIMGEDPLAALVWLANELPKHGYYLHAGDFVVTGTVCAPPPVSAGDSASVVFTNLGSLKVDFVE